MTAILKDFSILQAESPCHRFRRGPSVWLFGPGKRLFVAKGTSQDVPGTLPASAAEAYCFLLCRNLRLSVPPAVAIDPCRLRADDPSCLDGIIDDLLFGSEVLYRTHDLFDYLPLKLHNKVSNSAEMRSWPIFDLWIGNAGRRAVFARAHDTFVALKISHHHCFDWLRSDTAVLDRRKSIYREACTGERDRLLAAIEKLASTPGKLESLARAVPSGFGGASILSESVVPVLRQRAAGLRSLV